jgi:TRAP-type C4-dicarboxylate transport system permease small subunit
MLFIAAMIVTGEIILRKVISPWMGAHYNLTGSDEIASYLFAVGTSWSMAYVLVTKGHVRIDALYGLFGPRVRAVMDLIALLVLGLFVAAFLERSFALMLSSFLSDVHSNTTLRIPLAIPQGGWVFGIALFMLTIVVAFVRCLAALLQGDFRRVGEIAGAASQDEEIEAELEGLGIKKSAVAGEN